MAGSEKPMGADDIYVCVDVEASGPVPGLYNLVSIGAVTVVARDGAPPSWERSGETFYVELKPIAPGFDAGAMAVHGISRRHLETNGIPAEEAMHRLAEFVRQQLRGSGGRAVFVGHNAVFDWAYISYYFERFKIPNPFGYKAIDTKALAMGRLGIDWFETGKDRLPTLLPSIPPLDPRRVHRADYDAEYQAEILCALLKMQVR